MIPSALRSQFPLLKQNPSLVYLDSASTTQKPESVLRAMDDYYTQMNANVHRALYPIGERATDAYEGVREKVRAFVKAESTQEIIFTRGATEALNIMAQGWGRQFLKAGDEILLTPLEHHSNLVPWQLIAERVGAVLKFIPLTSEGDLDYDQLSTLCTEKTRVVSVTGLSNTLGTVVSLARIREAAARVGALFCVDAAQLVAHFPIDVKALNVDMLAFSSHKMYGPTGLGVLYAKRSILESMDPWLGGGDMIREVHLDHSTWNDLPWKFEAGTPPIAEVIGLGAAVDFLSSVGWDELILHDRELHAYALDQLAHLPFVSLFGLCDTNRSSGVLSFIVKDVHPHDVAAFLGQKNICLRAGHHCTMPLMKTLGVTATTRMSFGVYNTREDIDALVEGLHALAKTFKL